MSSDLSSLSTSDISYRMILQCNMSFPLILTISTDCYYIILQKLIITNTN